MHLSAPEILQAGAVQRLNLDASERSGCVCVCAGGGGYNTEKLSLSSIGKMNLNASQRTEGRGGTRQNLSSHILRRG